MGFRQIDSANKKATRRWLFMFLAERTGLEPATPGVTGRGIKSILARVSALFAFQKKAKQATVSCGFPHGVSKILGRTALTTPSKSNRCRHRGSNRWCGGFVIFGRWIGQPLDR
jgi:hypothetical protein